MGEVQGDEPRGDGEVDDAEHGDDEHGDDEHGNAEHDDAEHSGTGGGGGGGGDGRDLTEVLDFLAKNIVENPDAVRIETVEGEGSVTLRLKVDQADMGKVIGRGGRTARALRTVLRAAGTRAGVNTMVEIVED